MVNWNNDNDTPRGATPIKESHCAACKRREPEPHMVTARLWHVPSRTLISQGGYGFHTVEWSEEWGDWQCTCERHFWDRAKKGRLASCFHVRAVTAALQGMYTPAPPPVPVKRTISLIDLFE